MTICATPIPATDTLCHLKLFCSQGTEQKAKTQKLERNINYLLTKQATELTYHLEPLLFLALVTRLKIGPRLIISFSVLLVLMGIIAIVSTSRIATLSANNESLINKDLSQLLLAKDINTEAEEAAIRLLTILSTRDREQRVNLYREMDQHIAKLNEHLEKLSKQVGSAYGLDKVITSRDRYRKSFQETVELVELDIETALEQFNDNTRPALTNLLSAIESMVSKNKAHLLQEHKSAVASSEAANVLILSIAVISIGLGVLMTLLIAKSITTPVRAAVENAKNIASGDLRHRPSFDGQDEMAELMQAFAGMSEGLSAHIAAIQKASQVVEESTTHMAQPVTSVANSSRTQNEAVYQIQQLVEEFASDANQAAITAENAKSQSNSAKELAIQGESLIQRATDEFKIISETISGSAQAVETLRERASSVRTLVTTVREIAEQTNLLALNAAIEAARAGESGRGFSVVADEVRGLANRTEQATSEINNVIDAMDDETKTAVIKITNGQKELEEGVNIIQEMVQPLNDLSHNAQASYHELEQLEARVMNQAKESTNIQGQLVNIASLAEENMLATQEVGHTSERLQNISQNLCNEVSQFKT